MGQFAGRTIKTWGQQDQSTSPMCFFRQKKLKSQIVLLLNLVLRNIFCLVFRPIDSPKTSYYFLLLRSSDMQIYAPCLRLLLDPECVKKSVFLRPTCISPPNAHKQKMPKNIMTGEHRSVHLSSFHQSAYAIFFFLSFLGCLPLRWGPVLSGSIFE